MTRNLEAEHGGFISQQPPEQDRRQGTGAKKARGGLTLLRRANAATATDRLGSPGKPEAKVFGIRTKISESGAIRRTPDRERK